VHPTRVVACHHIVTVVLSRLANGAWRDTLGFRTSSNACSAAAAGNAV